MKAQSTAILVLVTTAMTSATAFAQSQVPYIFQAGQPARAAEVNENFDSLDQRLQQLETSPSTVAAQVLTAIPLTSETRYLFTEYYQFKGSFPLDNDAAGAEMSTDIQNDFISSVAVTADKVVATFGNNAGAAIQNDTLEFVPNVSGDGIYFTCNPTGGVVAFFNPDACVIADQPPEPLMSIRKQVASAVSVAHEARWMVEDYYKHFGIWPSDNFTAGTESPANIVNYYVESVTITNNTVVAVFGNDAHPMINGEILRFDATDNLGSLSWACRAPNIPDRYTGFTVSYPCSWPLDEPPLPAVLIRQQVQSGLSLATDVQNLVEQFYNANGFWPQSNAEAGAPPANTILNRYVSSVSVGAGGVISIGHGNDAHIHLNGHTVTLRPTDNIGSITWACVVFTVPDRFRPYECRL